MNLFLKSQFALWLIPLIALAVTPTNPSSLCDRFVGEAEQKVCEVKTAKEEVDWYAATVCGQMSADGEFWKCWDKIKGAQFSPVQLDRCQSEHAATDADRITCVEKSRLPRSPASQKSGDGEFQSLKISR